MPTVPETFIVPKNIAGIERDVEIASEQDATSLARATLPTLDGEALVLLRAVFQEIFQAFAMYGPDYSARLIPR